MFVIWILLMGGLFLFWYVTTRIRQRQKEQEAEEWLTRWKAKQPKQNVSSCCEMGDTVTYRFVDGIYENRKMTVTANHPWGAIFMGHSKGDELLVPFPQDHWYRPVVIKKIDKGMSVQGEVK